MTSVLKVADHIDANAAGGKIYWLLKDMTGEITRPKVKRLVGSKPSPEPTNLATRAAMGDEKIFVERYVDDKPVLYQWNAKKTGPKTLSINFAGALRPGKTASVNLGLLRKTR